MAYNHRNNNRNIVPLQDKDMGDDSSDADNCLSGDPTSSPKDKDMGDDSSDADYCPSGDPTTSPKDKSRPVWDDECDTDDECEPEQSKFENAKVMWKHLAALIKMAERAMLDRHNSDLREVGAIFCLLAVFHMRIGNDSPTPARGACSLLREDFRLQPPFQLLLDFTGKSGVPFRREKKIGKVLYAYLEDKLLILEDTEPVFTVKPRSVNAWLGMLVPGHKLTTKMMRTMIANVLAQEVMRKEPAGGVEQVKMAWRKAQEAAAQEVNHKVAKKGAITSAELEEKIRLTEEALEAGTSEEEFLKLEKRLQKLQVQAEGNVF